MSVLAGYTRYAHISAIRCDGVNPNILGMTKVTSEDTVRRVISKIEEDAGNNWLTTHLKKSYIPLLSIPWIMDIDTTVKPLYGKQEGAKIGYNPTKPGRPSHIYHTYHIANIRMMLDVEVQDGKCNTGCYSAPRLWSLLEAIPKYNWPSFIRGDSSYGNENIMKTGEQLEVKYLFKLKCTTKVKSLIANIMIKNDWSCVGQGWEAIESELLLHGWSKERRVVLLRRKLSDQQIGVTKKKLPNQLELEFLFAGPTKDITAYEYQVLVTNLDEKLSAIAQHYRDRADCENNFDELKNQWGWCGYTTQDLKRCRFMAKITAIIYNWWTIFTRLANPESHLEAVTSRPLLLHAVAKQTTHVGKTKLTITSNHSKSNKITVILSAISKFFKKLKTYTEQSSTAQIFLHILLVAFRKFLPANRLNDIKLLPDSC